ncbi:MAG: O-antigen ligase family protein [Longimicrobiales bacterium]
MRRRPAAQPGTGDAQAMTVFAADWLDGPAHAPRAQPGTAALLFAAGVLCIASVGWLQISALANTGATLHPSAIVIGTFAAFLVAHALTKRWTLGVPLLIAGGTVGFAVLRADVLLGGPLAAPLGYANAAGALFLLAAAAALLIVARTRTTGLRIAAAAAAISFAAVPLLNHTRTATVFACLIPLGLLARTARGVRLATAVSGALIVIAFSTTVMLAFAYRAGGTSGAVDGPIDATLSQRRLALWNDALVLFVENPATGVGPGQFAERGAVPAMDPDSRWPHSEPLHAAAETGLPGLLLLAGIVAWAFICLWAGTQDAGTAIVALALGAVGVQASIDYVLHSAALPMITAALVAAGARLPGERGSPP